MDLLEDVVPLRPHPNVGMRMPPVDLDALEQLRDEALATHSVLFPIHINELTSLIAELRALRSEHARPSPNGRVHGAYTHVCASCGTEFTSNRRAVPGRKSWCGKADCRKVAAAERARDYRDRKTKEKTP